MKQKAFFIIFKGLLVAKNCLRPESASLIGASTENIPYLSIVASQHKTKQRRVRHVMMGDARSSAGS